MTFGEQLKNHRREKGLSQEELANLLYVTRQSVSQWENDKTMPSVDLLVKLSEIFGTTVDALLGKPETDEEPQPIASAPILNDKKSIMRVMRYRWASTRNTLGSLAIHFALFGLLVLLLHESLFSEELAAHEYTLYITDLTDLAIEAFTATVLCCIACAVFIILQIVSARKAARYGSVQHGTLRFFYDHFVIANEDNAPISLFYANIRRITETDDGFIFLMQNKKRLCVDKNALGDSVQEVSGILRSAGNYQHAGVMRSGENQRANGRQLLRDFLFAGVFILPPLVVLQYQFLNTGFTEPQAPRWLFAAFPVIYALTCAGLGLLLKLRHAKTLRMVIAGGIVVMICMTELILINTASTPLYNWQNKPIIASEFCEAMEQKGLTVENAIKGRNELYISECYRIHPENHAFEIMVMGFDKYSYRYGLKSAWSTYENQLTDVRSQPRNHTAYSTQNLAINRFYTETTDKHYAYLSLNEYTVIIVKAPIENKEQVQEALKEFELKRPY